MTHFSITDLPGVYASSIFCGIKKKRNDLVFIYVPQAVGSAGVFTQNRFCASCVTYTKKNMKKNIVKAAIINSGNANAGTGERGAQDTKRMATLAAQSLGLKPSEVAVSSTGCIGEFLPMDKLEAGIPKLLENPFAREGHKALEGIMTTDLFPKSASITRKIVSHNITITGITKGAGMIAPNMATTLTYLVTNASLNSKTLQPLLKHAVDHSFNMTSVDTDTSTNDMVLLWSTGEVPVNTKSKEEMTAFQTLLTDCCIQLAKQLVKDGEGATKNFEVHVTGAFNTTEARKIAMNVANSPLVKTAIHGEDPNWGRIIAAASKDPSVKINPDKVELKIQGVSIYANGAPTHLSRAEIKPLLKDPELMIELNLNIRSAGAIAYGCDLTKTYIDINTAYT